MTGLSLGYVDSSIESFWEERKDDSILNKMSIDDYFDKFNI
jgi:hypothetical protein